MSEERELVEQLAIISCDLEGFGGWNDANDEDRAFWRKEMADKYVPAIRSHTNALVAAAYGACAKELNAELESIKDEDAEVRAIQRLLKVRTRIHSLTLADAAKELERRLAEAERKGRLEEAKWWQEYMDVNRGYRSAPNDLGSMRIADLSQPKEVK